MKTDEFDQQFERYLKDRFKPFRDKERPADYGRDLSPNTEKTHFAEALSIAPSPSGDLIAAVTVNRKDRELDIILRLGEGRLDRPQPDAAASTRTWASTTSSSTASGSQMPWMSWSPKGDRLAYFVRTEKERTLIIQNVLTRKIEQRDPDEDGRRARVAGVLARRQDDRVRRRCATRSATSSRSTSRPSEVTNLTNDDVRRLRRRPTRPTASSSSTPRASAATRSCSGSISTRRRRRSSPSARTTRPRRSSSTTTRSSSRRRRPIPTVPLEPEVAQERQHLQHLDARPEERRAAAVHRRARRQLVAGRAERGQDEPDRVRQLLQGRVQHPHARAEGAAAHGGVAPTSARPGPIIDFQAPLQHTLVADNERKKRHVREDVPRGPAAGERRRHEQRRHLRRHRRSASATCSATSSSTSSPRRSRSTARCRSSYVNLSRRFQYALQGFSQTQFFYGQLGGVLLRPVVRAAHQPRPTRSRRAPSAAAAPSASTRSTATAASSCPAASCSSNEEYNDPALQAVCRRTISRRIYGQPVLPQRHADAARRRVRPGDDGLPRVRPAGRQHDAARLRRRAEDRQHCCRARPSTPTRATTCASAAPACWRYAHPRLQEHRRLPRLHCTSAATRELRGYDYLQFVGQNAVFANAELRFPLIEAALTPIGVIGGIRGVFFADIGGAWFSNQPSPNPCTGESSSFKFADEQRGDLPGADRRTSSTRPASRSSSPTRRPASRRRCSTTRRRRSSGFRLQDGRASYGLGLETFALGFPIHFDWSWRTLVQQGLGGRRVRLHSDRRAAAPVRQRRRRLPQAALRGLDRLRLLNTRPQGSRDERVEDFGLRDPQPAVPGLFWRLYFGLTKQSKVRDRHVRAAARRLPADLLRLPHAARTRPADRRRRQRAPGEHPRPPRRGRPDVDDRSRRHTWG